MTCLLHLHNQPGNVADLFDMAPVDATNITNTADWWEAQMQRADGTYEDDPKQVKTGRELIEAKLDIVRNYMSEMWGIDMDEARAAIQRRQAEVLSGQVSLTDLTIK